ncbi:hypothetical protein [Nitrospirillum amazonense]|uniref:Hemolysin type calcium-binding protein n=1 Tax=Nitrospirillum amazonense TaxID=28077 RepID=A0A560J331_9PROT|nr:hypothetical protein [Nitrospirillum amazonense]MDG3441085.1 hypothetical protein [Nitrospirillum amazonense]TWB65658.1 hypothetical protein FBZ87_12055 [Nitrospirillum amazonense]
MTETITTVSLPDGGKRIIGTSGDDALVGTAMADYISGAGGNDTLTGGGGVDILVGGAGDDSITGAGLLVGGAGDDTITGTGSVTTALYDVKQSQAAVTRAGATVTITTPDGGTDTLSGVQYAQFSDGIVQLSTVVTPIARSMPNSGESDIPLASLFSIVPLPGATPTTVTFKSTIRWWDGGNSVSILSNNANGVTVSYADWLKLYIQGDAAGHNTATVQIVVSDGVQDVSATAVLSTARHEAFVSSITSMGGTPDGGAQYQVTFNDNVTGVDAGDFMLVKTGTADGTVTNVNGSGKSYVVTVGAVSGLGSLQLGIDAGAANLTDTDLYDPIVGTYSHGYGTTYTADVLSVNRPAVLWTDTTASQSSTSAAFSPYEGPVDYLRSQFLWSSNDNVAIKALGPNVYLRGGAGQDALAVSAGSNVLDGGGGSNFLVGATGQDGGSDVFFIDAQDGLASWSTVVNFHAGDTITIWGYSSTSTSTWGADEGADGFKGATLQAALGGAGGSANTYVTLAGLSLADIQNHVTQTVGTSGAGGLTYLALTYHG